MNNNSNTTLHTNTGTPPSSKAPKTPASKDHSTWAPPPMFVRIPHGIARLLADPGEAHEDLLAAGLL